MPVFSKSIKEIYRNTDPSPCKEKDIVFSTGTTIISWIRFNMENRILPFNRDQYIIGQFGSSSSMYRTIYFLHDDIYNFFKECNTEYKLSSEWSIRPMDSVFYIDIPDKDSALLFKMTWL